jgi:hypothetical protein
VSDRHDRGLRLTKEEASVRTLLMVGILSDPFTCNMLTPQTERALVYAGTPIRLCSFRNVV